MATEKTAVGKQTGGFQQTRKGVRPYRVDTLTRKQIDQRPSEQFESDHPSKPNEDFEAALASTAGDEFEKEAETRTRWRGTERFVQSRTVKRDKTHKPTQRVKTAELTPGPGEFAPGIPKNRQIKAIPKVKEKGPNEEWTASLSKHPAARRGDHLDLRLVDPKGRAHSFALNQMPDPGKSTYAAQQPTHSKAYAERKKPFSIPINVYGGTRPGAKVEPQYVAPVEVISSGRNRLHLLRHTGQETEELVMRRVAQGGDGTPLWALHNATKTRGTQEGRRLPDSKERYKEVPIDAVDTSDDQQVMTAKLDGAHTLVDLPKANRMVRTYSYRPTQRKSGLIEHTFKFPDFHTTKTPKALQGTLIRAETWASKDGKAIPAAEVGGILNSGVPRARSTLRDQGIELRRTGIDVLRFKGRDVSNKPFGEKLDMLEQVSKATKGAIEMPIVARTQPEKHRLLKMVVGGKLPETKEGVILHELHTNGPPTKAKVRPDTDVYVREIFSKSTSPKGQAGGFAYALEPDGPVVGRVGTGLSSQLRREMLDAPEKFVGRVAKVRSAGQHVSSSGKPGALVGSPAFKEWHIDKTPPELMKVGNVDPEKTFKELSREADPERLVGHLRQVRQVKALDPLLERPEVRKGVGNIKQFYLNLVGKREAANGSR